MSSFEKRKHNPFINGQFDLERPCTLQDVEEIKIEQVNGEFVAVYVLRSTALMTTPKTFNKPIANRNVIFGVKMYG